MTAPQYREAAIDLHAEYVINVMLGRLCVFGSDPAFERICKALAGELGISQIKATELLWPTSHAIYQAALESTAGIRQLQKTIGSDDPDGAESRNKPERHVTRAASTAQIAHQAVTS